MLPIRRNLRRYESKWGALAKPDWPFWFGETGERRILIHGPRMTLPTHNTELIDYYPVIPVRSPFSIAFEGNADRAESTASSMMYVGAWLPRVTEDSPDEHDPISIYYDSLIDYEYNYSTFNAIPGTMVNDQWSVEEAAADNYPYDHVYAKTSKPNYSGQTFVYDVVSDPTASAATWENHLHSTQWRDSMLALYPGKNKIACQWNGDYSLAGAINGQDVAVSGVIDVARTFFNVEYAFYWSEDRIADPNNASWGDQAVLRCEQAGSWLMYHQATNVAGNLFQYYTVPASGNFPDATTIIVSTDQEWEMIVNLWQGYVLESGGYTSNTYDPEEERKYYNFAIYRVSSNGIPDSVGGGTNGVEVTNYTAGTDIYSGTFGLRLPGPGNHLTNDELREFLDAFTHGSSFGDEVKRFHVDQAESTLYLGTTNTNFWLDGDYPWHELKKYTPIALNDDFYLVGGYDLEGGYHKIKLDSTTFLLSRGEGGVFPPADGTFNRDGNEQDILYISGADSYGRTIDWAANNGGQLWLSADGDTWTEETAIIWGAFDANSNTQTISGVTIDPTANVYVSFVDPAVGVAITENYELSSLRIIPEPIAEASPRPLKGGEWEFVSSTEFHFSEQSLEADHSFPASGSVYLSRDGGTTYEEFIIGSATTASSVVEVTWAGGSPVWTDAPADIRMAYLDPAVEAVSADKKLASFYFHVSDASSQDITTFVNTEEIQFEDHLKINDTLYEIKEVDAQAGYVRFGVDADLSSIATGPAKVEFIHSEQPYTFFTQDGDQHRDIDIFQSWLAMIYDSEPFQFVNPVTGLREDDWWGRKAVRVRVDSGEIITIPMQSPRPGEWRTQYNEDRASGMDSDAKYGLPNEDTRTASLMIQTGFNQLPGLQEPGVRRHRQGDLSWEFIDMKQPRSSTVSPFTAEDLNGKSEAVRRQQYMPAVLAEDFSVPYLNQEYGLWNANIEASYGSDRSIDWIGSNPTRERWRPAEDILGQAPKDESLDLAFTLERMSGLHWLDESYPWWDINVGAEGHAHYSPQEWEGDKRPWRVSPDAGYLEDLTGAVIDYDERITYDYSPTTVDQLEIPIVVNVDYFPYKGGSGGGDGGDGGGGGSSRPDSGLIYPRRFG